MSSQLFKNFKENEDILNNLKKCKFKDKIKLSLNKREFLDFLKEIKEKVPLDAYVSYFAKKITDKEERIFKVIVSTILSARTKDEITAKISEKLFEKVKNWDDLNNIELKKLENLIYGVGFYKNKAKQLKKLAEYVVKNNYNIPDELEKLKKLPGIGTKTANIILVDAFNKNGLAVDTHVHRIVNRISLLDTNYPEESESELKKMLNEKDWKDVNALLVSFGRQICNVNPKCERCFFKNYCPYNLKLKFINRVLKCYKFKKLKLNNGLDELENKKGVYILKIYLKEPTKIFINKKNKKLKIFNLKKAWFFYIGSAGNGLKHRIKRHLSKDKKLFWHIDYLLDQKKASVKEIYYLETEDYNKKEKELSNLFSKYLKRVPNFGNSDDKRNNSHLFYLEP